MNKKAFTLIEVLILVVIAGVLLFIAVPSFDKVSDNNDYNRMHSFMITTGVASMNFQEDRGIEWASGEVNNSITIPSSCPAISTSPVFRQPGYLVVCDFMKESDWDSDNYKLYACPDTDIVGNPDCDDAYAYIELQPAGNQDLCPLAQFSYDQELVYPSGGACDLGF